MSAFLIFYRVYIFFMDRYIDMILMFIMLLRGNITSMASQHIDDGSFPLNPKNRSSVPTLCFRIISYLHTEVIQKKNLQACAKTHSVVFNKLIDTNTY